MFGKLQLTDVSTEHNSSGWKFVVAATEMFYAALQHAYRNITSRNMFLLFNINAYNHYGLLRYDKYDNLCKTLNVSLDELLMPCLLVYYLK